MGKLDLMDALEEVDDKYVELSDERALADVIGIFSFVAKYLYHNKS